MTTAQTARLSAPWYKQFWPWFLIALPAAAVIGCMISINIAYTHADIPIDDNYEKHGLTVLHKTEPRSNAAETRDIRKQ